MWGTGEQSTVLRLTSILEHTQNNGSKSAANKVKDENG